MISLKKRSILLTARRPSRFQGFTSKNNLSLAAQYVFLKGVHCLYLRPTWIFTFS